MPSRTKRILYSAAAAAMILVPASAPAQQTVNRTVTQQTSLAPSDGAARFSYSVAVSGDGSTALVGAPSKDGSPGAAYVFTRSGTGWIQQQKLSLSDNANYLTFGYSVALSGDGSTALVGAFGKDASAGAVYVFKRSGAVWTQLQILIVPDRAAGDNFGRFLALSGDGSTALVGAPDKDSQAGAAYVLTGLGEDFLERQKLIASDTAAFDAFGVSVALSSDGTTALVGSRKNFGAAYVFTRSGTDWTEQQILKAPDGKAGANFGDSVALSGDGKYALVGADGMDSFLGAAYVFTRSNKDWGNPQKLPAPALQRYARFGQAVALSSDGSEALVGAPGYPQYSSGVAYLYARTDESWAEVQDLPLSADKFKYSQFGSSVALSGDGSALQVGQDTQNSGQVAAYSVKVQMRNLVNAQLRNQGIQRLLLCVEEGCSVGIPGPVLDSSKWSSSFTAQDGAQSKICAVTAPNWCLGATSNTGASTLSFGAPGMTKDAVLAQTWVRRRVAAPDGGSALDYVIESAAFPGTYLYHRYSDNPSAPTDYPTLKRFDIASPDPFGIWAFDSAPVSDARSVHLNYDPTWYQASLDTPEFYIELNVTKSQPHTYFAEIGFTGGYFGIQQLTPADRDRYGCGPVDKLILFSLWNKDKSDEKNPKPEERAYVMKLGAGANRGCFKREGAGIQTFKCFNWQAGTTYKFYIRSHVESQITTPLKEKGSVYQAYFQGPDGVWQFIAESRRPAAGIQIQRPYSFLEDFMRNGDQDGVEPEDRSPFQSRFGQYMNPWFKGENGSWIAFQKAMFTAYTSDPPDHGQTNISLTAPPDRGQRGVVFQLGTGGPIPWKGPALNSIFDITTHSRPSAQPIVPPATDPPGTPVEQKPCPTD
jgi:hypothetical protein